MSQPISKIDLSTVVEQAQLPALPQSAIQLLELSQDENIDSAAFARPIESDPGLTSQVLRFVNSSYFGFSREISSVKLAITLVGMRTIKNFALWSAVFSLMPNPKCGPFDLKSLWQDSLRRALFARKMLESMGHKESEDAFIAALLQDMSIPLLAKHAPSVYAMLLEAREEKSLRLSEIEKKLFGWTHGQAAAKIARRWNLPESVGALVENHEDIERFSDLSEEHIAPFVVALSGLLPSVVETGWSESAKFVKYYDMARRPDGLAITEILAETDAEVVEFAPVLKLSMPGKPLVDIFQEATTMAEPVAADS